MTKHKTYSQCAFSSECPVYSGEKPTKTPLHIYRNVFCNRKEKGWNNCEQYREYQIKELIN